MCGAILSPNFRVAGVHGFFNFGVLPVLMGSGGGASKAMLLPLFFPFDVLFDKLVKHHRVMDVSTTFS